MIISSERGSRNRSAMLVMLLALLLSGCALLELSPLPSAAPDAPTAELLASVNGVKLTRADLNRRLALTQIAAWLATGSAPAEQEESVAVNQWIDSELMAQAAAKANVTATPAEAEQEIAKLLRDAKLDETDLLRQLNLVGVTRDEFAQYEQRAVAVQKFMETHVLAGASEVERAGRLLTWLVRERGSAKIEKPTVATGPKQTGVYAGALAPTFALKDMAGAEQQLESLRGKVVLLNFWATWCGPCRAEMPAIQRAYLAHQAEGFVVWAVNVGEPPDLVQSYVRELDLRFPILLDRDSKVSRQYRVVGLPTSVFIGRDGVIRQIVIGEMAPNSLDGLLDRMLR